MICPCCSGADYNVCCQPFHLKTKFPTSAEQLMRSRYSAYALPQGRYLMETTHPSMRRHHDARDMEQWGHKNVWIKLEIISTPAEDIVEFKAYYHDKSDHEIQLHHERSLFKMKDGKWYYHSSEFIHI